MTRMYLRVPSTSCEPGRPCNRYYFDNGEMVDLTADVRCGTCAHFDVDFLCCDLMDSTLGSADHSHSLASASDTGQVAAWVHVDENFGCVMWEARNHDRRD